MTDMSKSITANKLQRRTVYTDQPLNIGSEEPSSFLTPCEGLFIRNHGTVPQVEEATYRLTFTGLVKSSLSFSLAELRTRFPATTIVATLQCAGNRRNELQALEEIPNEIIWEGDAIGTASWRGVALRELLQLAEVLEGAEHVAFTGLDKIQLEEGPCQFGGSIPLAKALHSEVLLAYEMNGEPLPLLHGFPLRAVVPGYIGARSVKWLANIHLQSEPSFNYYQRHAYRLFAPTIKREQADWSQAKMLGPLPLNSFILRPHPDEVLRSGPTVIQGYALSGEESPLARVEVSADAGASWQEAPLQGRSSDYAWHFWEASLDLQPGSYTLIVRAWNAANQTQPAELGSIWNWKGYANHAWHRIVITVE